MDVDIDIQDFNKIRYHLDIDDDQYLDLNEFIPFVDLIRKNKAAREMANKKWTCDCVTVEIFK